MALLSHELAGLPFLALLSRFVISQFFNEPAMDIHQLKLTAKHHSKTPAHIHTALQTTVRGTVLIPDFLSNI